jgi:hypothetical protein
MRIEVRSAGSLRSCDPPAEMMACFELVVDFLSTVNSEKPLRSIDDV